MSHMAILSLCVTSIQDLEAACKMCGLVLETRTEWRWVGRWFNDYSAKDAAFHFGIKPEEYGKCAEYVITIPGNNTCYEIGVVPRRDGKEGYLLAYDFIGGGRGMDEHIGGKDGKKLEHAYTVAKAMRKFGGQNFKVARITEYDAKTQTTLIVMSRPKVTSAKGA